jgi:FAD/FMN-containing dehydrogenase
MRPPPDFAGLWRDDDRARAAYSEGAGIYRILPRAVAVPSTTAALRRLVEWARGASMPLVPRGAGSGMPGGNVGEGVVVDLTALDGAPLRVDRAARLAMTGAAATLGDLDELAARDGLRMPVDPSSARWVTTGGAVSTNAAGARSVMHGSVRGWVQAFRMVTSDGEVVALARGETPPDCAVVRRFRDAVEPALRAARWRVASTFPKVRKNTCGYALDAYLASGDLLDLVIGAEGTLGIVTDVTWRLEPAPTARAGVRAAIKDVRRLAHCVPAVLELGPSRVEFLDRTFLDFVADELPKAASGPPLAGADALLMIEFEGDRDLALASSVERAAAILRPESVEVLAAGDDRETEAVWAVRHAASPLLARLGDQRRSLQVIEDGCVPLGRLGDYVLAVRSAAERAGIPIVLFGHAGDGNVHANLLPDTGRPGWADGVRGVAEEVSRVVLELGGTPSGEHGDGRLRAPLAERLYGAEMTQLFHLVKRAFDPDGILNPGVKLGSGFDPLASLKVGASARSLPAEVERGLRWIERNAGYAADRLALADDPSSWSGR